jgi:hypothetical protein
MNDRQMTSRKKLGLTLCLAAPLTVLAALSENIARHLGISQLSLLIVDGIAALLLLLFTRNGRGGNQSL